jgi:hypothetical protein
VRAQDPFSLHLVGTKGNSHEAAPEIVGMLLEDLRKACKQVIRGDHETHIACRGNTGNLIAKIAAPGEDNIIPAAPETVLQHIQHCGTFRSEERIVSGGIFGKQDFHYFFFVLQGNDPIRSVNYLCGAVQT